MNNDVLKYSKLLFLILCVLFSEYQLSGQSLDEGFKNPPVSARPRAYLDFIDGNFNLSQISYELREMKAKGMGGFDIWDVKAPFDPNGIIPAGPSFLGKESIEAIAYTIREATRLNLEVGLVLSSSWNAGGSWVKPEHATMGLYTSKVLVEGPVSFFKTLVFPDIPEKDKKGKKRLLYKDEDGLPSYYKDVTVLAYPVNENNIIPSISDVINLSKNFSEDGFLKWDVPVGEWEIIRYVCTNTGQPLIIPSPNSNGLMLDHFSGEAMNANIEYIIEKLLGELGSFENTALKYLYADSYELMEAAWTPKLIDEFKTRRGYDMTPYLPVLSGNIVESKEISDRFLFDYKMTLSDLIIDYHYKRGKEICNKYGLGFYAEAGGPGEPVHDCPFESLKALGALDVPRGEFWNKHEALNENGIDLLWLVKEIASAAHIYDQNIVEAESFTSLEQWQEGPAELKPLADRAMCEGLNRFIFHTFPHTPPEAGVPGWAYHAGTHINTTRVWWPKSAPFINYLARSSYLLQQGNFVGDVLYYYGDKAPNFVPPKHIDPSLGFGYDYDVTNTEIILTRLSVEDGKLTLPNGQKYEVLVLPDQKDINLKVLQKLESLIKDGATIVGRKPSLSNGLKDFQIKNNKITKLADKMWGDCDGISVKEQQIRKGKIVCGKKLKDILLSKNATPDFSFKSNSDSTELDFIHRTTESEEIYFVSNKNNRRERFDGIFRVSNKVPEIWNAENGEIYKQSVYEIVEGGIKLPLQLEPFESVFVVFREKPAGKHIVSIHKDDQQLFPLGKSSEFIINYTEGENEPEFVLNANGKYHFTNNLGEKKEVMINELPDDMEISGPWEIRFPQGWGAPTRSTFPELESWTESLIDGIKHFSGIATYYKTINVNESLIQSDSHITLDLGHVKEVADVFLNGRPLGIQWKAPYKYNITEAVKPGENHLVVEVANVWSNRLTGDAKLPENQRHTNTNITGGPQAWTTPWKDVPLIESGLMGPVKIKFSKTIK